MVDIFNLPGALKIANPTHLAHRADQNKQTQIYGIVTMELWVY